MIVMVAPLFPDIEAESSISTVKHTPFFQQTTELMYGFPLYRYVPPYPMITSH